MEQNSKYIISLLLFTGGAACCYFLSLLAGLPFIVPVLLAACLLYGLYYFLFRGQPVLPYNTGKAAAFIFVLSLYYFADNALRLAAKHGGWDAWAIWNLHARYLRSPEHWQNMFLNTESEHPDYPLCQPAFLAFLIRLAANHFSLVLTFTFSLVITLCGPLLIFSELTCKNFIIACIVFLFCAQDIYYIATGVSQYADTLLSVFLLAALVTFNHAAENIKYITVCAALLGFAAFTKNEGVILASVFLIFYLRTFCSKKNIKYTLAGLALPVITVVLFKLKAGVTNDMAASVTSHLAEKLTDPHRYKLIYDSLINNVNQNFYYTAVFLMLYLLVNTVQQKWPGRQLLLLITCLMLYMGIYLITPRDLAWHLETSQSRLLHQLMPSFIYVIALQAAGVKINFAGRFSS
ncbi:MAG: hypothetical protein H7257_11715 [Taibaiella sp.]|nr:hypothetical protein [Taibaiella sp.]